LAEHDIVRAVSGDGAEVLAGRLGQGRGRPGAIRSIELDFLPVTAAERPEGRALRNGWLGLVAPAGIDYFIGHRLPATLAELGFDGIAATGRDNDVWQRL